METDIRLTRKEARLLEILQANPGVCLSRQFLLGTVWGHEEGVKSRTVDVHVWKLRRKLASSGRDRIRTIARQGYYWEPETGNGNSAV